MALHRKSGGVRVTSATITSVSTVITETDPLVTVNEDLVFRREFAGARASASAPANTGDDHVSLAYRAGQVVRRSRLLALMSGAVVSGPLSPATGPAAGGTTVTVKGTGLAEVTAVTVNGVAATAVTVVDDTTVTFVTPATTAGARDVVITDDAGAVTVVAGFVVV